MRVLVTGGTGFIGSYVLRELLSRGYQPIVLDRIAHQGSIGVDRFVGDVRDANAVSEAAAHAEGIIHLAAVLGTQETITNPRPSAETNILGSLNVFEAAVEHDLPVVYAAVGNHWMREHGAGSYVISKTAVEDYAKMFNKHRGGRINVVRPCNAYGPGQPASRPFGWSPVRKVMPAFICRALSGRPIEVYGDGEQVSDMVHVQDVAHVFVKALELAGTGTLCDTIEVGPSGSHTVNEIAQKVVDAVLARTFLDTPIVHLPMRRGEVPNATVAADVGTMTAAGIDHSDFVGIKDGIQRTVDWFAQQEGTHWTRPKVAEPVSA